MQGSSLRKTGNRLFDGMPAQSLERLQADLEPVALALAKPVPPGKHVYFPLAGLISEVATMVDGATVESRHDRPGGHV
jgi:hypothetical protein